MHTLIRALARAMIMSSKLPDDALDVVILDILDPAPAVATRNRGMGGRVLHAGPVRGTRARAEERRTT